MPAAELRGICKSFGGVAALRDVSLKLEAGRIHALLGENGAGKSTLAKILAGRLAPDSGEIRRGGAVAMVYQHFTLAPELTVLENWALGGGGFWIRRAHRRKQLLDWCARLGFRLMPDRRVADCSMGERQRLEILKALAREPRILILDEPTAVLAPGEVQELLSLLAGLRDAGIAVVLVTHKLAEVEQAADEVTILRGGEKVAHLTRPQYLELGAAGIGELLVGPDSPKIKSGESRGPSGPLAGAGQSPAQGFDRAAKAGAPPPHPGQGPEAPGPPEFLLRFAREGGVALELRPGEIVGVAGVEGNGQEELCRLVAGLTPPRRGEIEFSGSRGYVPADRHSDGLALGLSVGENLMLRARRERRFRLGPFLRLGSLRAWASEAVRRFDVRTRGIDQPAAALSGGNQQKLVLARELLANPQVLVVAHPTRGLDILASAAVRQRLIQLAADGGAVLLVSSDLDEILEIATRVLVLSRGRLLAPPPASTRAEIGILMTQ